ncbi:MAG: phosphoenolpyruvate carboxykinase (GTP), partial [Oscillospiraceae bacterium]|nr:phosphoenolpyruvate carboxykinase (GTP) [Oscillospiraceae bacterium]
FRTDEDGKFLWPGFGDNLRVLEWILKRCDDEIGADETAIGYVPKAEDINREGIEDEVTLDILKEILSVDADLWKEDAANLEEFYAKIQSVGNRMPKEMYDQLEGLKSRLG